MDFRFYFLKEGTRIYDKSELINFFSSNPYISVEKRLDDRIFTYHHPILDFDARFIMSSRSNIPHIERLNPKYFDINLLVEFDVLLPTYCVELILDIVEDICKTYRFYVYNQAYQDVNPFKRIMMIKAFEVWKKAYKDNHEDEISTYNYIDPQALAQIYGYLIRKPMLNAMVSKSQVPDYQFLTSLRSRIAYVSIVWDGNSSFVYPPAVDILYYDDGKQKVFIPINELMTKADKLFKPIDGYGFIRILDSKNVSKLKKIINKTKFSPLNTELKVIDIDNILDV